ncbi:MAG: hypothetical protein QOK35_665 [Pseudonocardiales bacterium]|nr:hypothetical protein [Pseudonocardiales bacterium]
MAAPDTTVPTTTSAFRRFYGAGPGHLAVLVVTLGAGAYALVTLLAGEQASWLRIGVWFLAAVFVNDLVLNPAAAVLDGVLRVGLHWLPDEPAAPTTINHIRVPLLGAALTFLMFFPGIVRQGEPVVLGQSGLDQSPFLLRWLLLVVGMIVVSALLFAVRTRRAKRAVTRRSAAGG